MYFKHLTILALVLSVTLLSNAGGRNQPTTGAPFETSQAACGQCHSGGSQSPAITATLINAQNEPVNSYVAGEEYTLSIKITNGTKYGFQAVVVNGSNAQAGSFTSLAADVRKLTLNNRDYITQKSASTTGVFTAKWLASTDDKVVVYAAGIAANGTGGDGGDKAIKSSFTFEAATTGTTDVAKDSKQHGSVINFPINSTLEFNKEINQFSIYDQRGLLVLNNNKDVSGLASGIYFLKYALNGKPYTQKFHLVK